jgi:alcohol dehydrogenase, propanol-preferring
MRAMVLEKAAAAEENPLRAREVPVPQPGAGEVRIRVRACGVCHTDLHTVEGDLPLPKLPVVPGHQVVGVVEAAGAGVRELREGDRVGIAWLNWACGECAYCRRGLENLCPRARFTGYHADGGYAEALSVPEAFAYRLPANFSDLEAAPLLCAGIIGYRSLRLSGAARGDRLGLYGFGASAHIVIQLARHLGMEVSVFTRSEGHRRLARELGAAWVGGASDQPPEPLDAAIIFAPAGSLVHDALRSTRPGGTVALAGISMSPVPATPYELLYHERTLRSVANSTRSDARELLSLAAEIPVRTRVQTFRLEEANRALQSLKHSRIDGAGVLVM